VALECLLTKTAVLCSVVEVRGRELASKAIEILHRHEISGRNIIVREVGIVFVVIRLL